MPPNATAGRSVPDSAMGRAALSALLLLFVSDVAFGGLVTKVGDLAIARHGATATLLADGRVLVAGGHSSNARLEIFDPQTGRSTLTDAVTQLPLLGHTATLLIDGRVLLAGGGYLTDGRPGFGNYGSTTSDAYAAGAITAAGRMNHFRQDHTATLLRDGRVLIAGGATLEIFDPQTETFTAAGSLLVQRSEHTATLLADGRVLIAGGNDEFGVTAEIYDPATNESEPAGDVGYRKGHTATLLPNGHVLIAGGAENAIVVDPQSSEIVESLAFDVARHAAVPLEDGSVLLAGGGKDFAYTTEVLRYRPTPLRPRRRAVR